MKDKEEEIDAKSKVHVTVLYTSTAVDKQFVTDRSATFQQTIDAAYLKLQETARPGDQIFCHTEPRHDLAPYLSVSLEDMRNQGICIRDNGKNKLELEFDIDSEIGGAADGNTQSRK